MDADRYLQPVPHQTILRTIATARIVLPKTIIRLAAGRQTFNESEQAMCFMAGANAVFTGEQMLTTPCTFDPPSVKRESNEARSLACRLSVGRRQGNDVSLGSRGHEEFLPG